MTELRKFTFIHFLRNRKGIEGNLKTDLAAF